MTSEQLLAVLEKLLKPILEESTDINYGRLPHVYGPKEGIEFKYKGFYCRLEVK